MISGIHAIIMDVEDARKIYSELMKNNSRDIEKRRMENKLLAVMDDLRLSIAKVDMSNEE